MALVKMSVGLTSFFALYAAALLGLGSLVGKKRRIFARRDFFLLPLLFGFVSLVGYGIIFFGVPLKWIDQCLMLSAKYRDVWAPSPWTSFKHLILRIFIWEPERMVWLLFFGLLGILAYFGLKRKKPATAKTDLAGMALLSLGLFALANSTEYFATDGLIYRFDFWIFPILVLLAGILSEWGSRVLSRPIKWVFGVLFLLLVLSSPLGSLRQAFASRVPERYLNLPRGRIYVGGSLSDLEVVKRTSSFIKENTEPGQEILAIPYDPLYCFLSERRHAVPELMFVESARMSDAREEEIIKVIETKQIPLILISNRYRSSEGGIGHFGQTHGKKLAQYIFSHYQDAETLGNWLPDSGRHSVKIFRRKV